MSLLPACVCTGLLHTWALVYPCVCVHVPECAHALECAHTFWMQAHVLPVHPAPNIRVGICKSCVCVHTRVCIHLCARITVSVGVSPPSPHQLLGTIPPKTPCSRRSSGQAGARALPSPELASRGKMIYAPGFGLSFVLFQTILPFPRSAL